MGLISRVSSRTYRKSHALASNFKMVFKKYIEIGRIVYIPGNGLNAVVDVIDKNHILVDSPAPNSRRKVNLKNIQLTKFKCEYLHGARTKNVVAAWKTADIDAKWAETSWSKTLAKKALRSGLNDFDRFKIMKLKQAKAQLVKATFNKMK